MTLLLANNAASTLANPVSALATTLIVQTADAGLFPTVGVVGDYFLCVLEDATTTPPGREIVRVDARVGNALTVRRAQEATTARAFPAGATISLRITAGTLAALVAQTITTLKAYPGILRVVTSLTDTVDPDGTAYLEGQYGIYTGTNTLYRYQGGAWGAALSFPQITGQVANTQLTPGSITDLLLAVHAVTAGALAPGAVGTAALASGAVTAGALASGSVGTANLSITDIVNNFLKVQTGYVGATQITPGAITTPALAAGSVVASALAAGDVVANFLAVQTGYISTAQIVNGAITNAKIGTAAVATANIATAAITSAKIGTGEIQTANIGLLNVTSAHIQSGALSNDFYVAAADFIGSPNGIVLSLTVTVPTGDARVVLFFYENVAVSGPCIYDTIIARNGSIIYSTSGFTYSRSQILEDTPPAGTNTYAMLITGSGTGNGVFDRELFALVLNK